MHKFSSNNGAVDKYPSIEYRDGCFISARNDAHLTIEHAEVMRPEFRVRKRFLPALITFLTRASHHAVMMFTDRYVCVRDSNAAIVVEKAWGTLPALEDARDACEAAHRLVVDRELLKRVLKSLRAVAEANTMASIAVEGSLPTLCRMSIKDSDNKSVEVRIEMDRRDSISDDDASFAVDFGLDALLHTLDIMTSPNVMLEFDLAKNFLRVLVDKDKGLMIAMQRITPRAHRRGQR